MDFCKNIPKVELHAHLNGSVSLKTLHDLRRLKMKDSAQRTALQESGLQWQTPTEFTKENFSKGFRIFDVIHQLVDNEKALEKLATDVIKEFAEDNVKYLELRTSPKCYPEMTKRSYLETIVSAIRNAEVAVPEIIVRLLVSIDRKRGPEEAMENVQLAYDFKIMTKGIVCGVDLSGDPSSNPACLFVPALMKAKELGLKLAVHLAEVPDVVDASILLDVLPDRIGHGTYLLPNNGGSQELIEKVTKNKIPLELCLTSNVQCSVVPSYQEHHICYWFKKGHPFSLATDDKGVFSTTLSQEYELMMETLNLSPTQVWDISCRTIDYIFADNIVKEQLQCVWKSHQVKL